VIEAGPSGACGLAALRAIAGAPGLAAVRSAAGLESRRSRALVIVTEGA
jgi:hypothetical protein